MILGNNSAVLDTIIYQLESCNNNCYNCYLTKSKANKENNYILEDLTKLIWEKKLDCNTFVLSLSSKYHSDSIYELLSACKMNKIITRVAVHNINDINSDWYKTNEHHIDEISFSRRKSFLCFPETNKKIIWNCMNESHFTIDNFQQQHKNKVSIIYNILQKSNIFQDNYVSLAALFDYQQVLKNTKDQNKFVTDKCLSCDCGAGRDFVHIWPSGNVTKCGYDYELITDVKGENLLDKIIKCCQNSQNHQCQFQKNRKQLLELINGEQ